MIETEEMKTSEVLVELDRLRERVAKFTAEETEYGRKGWAAAQEIERLEGEARTLARRDPELVDAFGVAVSKSNPVGKLQAAREMVEDPAALYAKRDHAAQIRQKAERELVAFVQDNFDQIHRARVPEAEKVRDQVRALRDQYRAAAEAFLVFAQESVALCAPHPEFNGQDVEGIDQVGDLLRVLNRLDDLPLPTVRGYGAEVPEETEPFFFEGPGPEREGDE